MWFYSTRIYPYIFSLEVSDKKPSFVNVINMIGGPIYKYYILSAQERTRSNRCTNSSRSIDSYSQHTLQNTYYNQIIQYNLKLGFKEAFGKEKQVGYVNLHRFRYLLNKISSITLINTDLCFGYGIRSYYTPCSTLPLPISNFLI